MFSFNRVTVAGNLVNTPKLRKTPGGASVTDFTVAVNEAWTDNSGKKQEGVVFVDVTAWGKLGETLCEYKVQGDGILVDGRLQQDKWIDKESGKNRSKLKVIADTIKFTGKRQSKPEEQREEQRAVRRDATKVGAAPVDVGSEDHGDEGAPPSEETTPPADLAGEKPISKEEAKQMFKKGK